MTAVMLGREPYAFERIMAYVQANTPPDVWAQQQAEIEAESAAWLARRIAAENAARLAKLSPRVRSAPTKVVALALIARGLNDDAYAHLLAAGWDEIDAARFVRHVLANVPVKRVGLSAERVAQMQIKVGQPWVAFLTLSSNGWSLPAARDFVLAELRRQSPFLC